jgi:hypothetical protein
VSLFQQQVLRALASCRTAALGGHLDPCDRCGHRRAVYHSCRNRHRPKCQLLAQEDWLAARRADLLPIPCALAKVFRGKLLAGLRRRFDRGDLGSDGALPALLHRLRQHDWVVYAKPPFAGPESVLRYLGRYTHRIALSNRRILRVEADQVALRYRDYADGSRTKVLTLSVHEFLRRFLLHVLPQGFVRIRHYGLLANRFRRQRIALCRALLAAEAPPTAAANENVRDKLLRLTGVDVTVCPACGEGRMSVVGEIDKHEAATAGVEILDSS